MTKHTKEDYIYKVISSGMSVLLEGEAGSGKTTIAQHCAKRAEKEFYSIAGTKQTTVNNLLGFISINGQYIPTNFRKAVEQGHYFLIDEIDAMDPNVLLALNTIENGYISFPDGTITIHEDFRLIATANPFDSHQIYTGRSKLDFSTLDRFFRIHVDRDPDLELKLTSQDVITEVTLARELLTSTSTTQQITMRDALRIHKLKQLGEEICTDPIRDVVFSKDTIMYESYTTKIEAIKVEEARKNKTQADAQSIDELWEIISQGK